MTPFVDDPDFTLFVGDALETLRLLPDGSVDCCVTSPPYWGLRDYGHQGQLGREESPIEYVEALVAVFAEVRRILVSAGTLWLNLGDSYQAHGGGTQGKTGQRATRSFTYESVGRKVAGLKPKDLVGIPWRVAFALQADGWYLRSDIVWSKSKSNPMPESVTDRPTKSHEYVFLLSKSARYFYDAAAIAEPASFYGPNGYPKSGPHAGQMHSRAKRGPTWEERKAAGAKRANRDPENVDASAVHMPGQAHTLGDGLTRNARSVWTIQTQQFADAHFAVFPEELPRRCILACCPEGGTVLDPFMGSGTTALVARKHGRKSVGIELNAEYARLAAKRLGQQSLLAEGAA